MKLPLPFRMPVLLEFMPLLILELSILNRPPGGLKKIRGSLCSALKRIRFALLQAKSRVALAPTTVFIKPWLLRTLCG